MTDIKKTYKNYVHGKFVRSESGKVYSIDLKEEKYEIPLTSKKDLRDAVTSCLLYTSPSPRDVEECRMPSSA